VEYAGHGISQVTCGMEIKLNSIMYRGEYTLLYYILKIDSDFGFGWENFNFQVFLGADLSSEEDLKIGITFSLFSFFCSKLLWKL